VPHQCTQVAERRLIVAQEFTPGDKAKQILFHSAEGTRAATAERAQSSVLLHCIAQHRRTYEFQFLGKAFSQ